VKPTSNLKLSHLVSDLMQTTPSRALILSGAPAERSQLAMAFEAELGRRIHTIGADLNGLSVAEAFVKSVSQRIKELDLVFR
jgi:hypothetical protein